MNKTVRVYNDEVGYIDYIPTKKRPPYVLKCPKCRTQTLKWDGSLCSCGHRFPNVPDMIPKCECGGDKLGGAGHSYWCPKAERK